MPFNQPSSPQLNRFIHPGLLDCTAAYYVLCDTPKLSVNMIDVFFTRHIENRAGAALNGAIALWDYPAASQALSLIVSTTISNAALANGSMFGGNYNTRNFNNNFAAKRGSKSFSRGGNRGSQRGNRGGQRGNHHGNQNGHQGGRGNQVQNIQTKQINEITTKIQGQIF